MGAFITSHIVLLTIAATGVVIVGVGITGWLRRRREDALFYQELDALSQDDNNASLDDGIIAVRKYSAEGEDAIYDSELAQIAYSQTQYQQASTGVMSDSPYSDDLVVINSFAKPGSQYMGYDLLQAILGAGLRYGDMQIFHRYQNLQSKDNATFSVASATDPGTFDMQTMSTTHTNGLTFFMRKQSSTQQNSHIFEEMLSCAEQITLELDGEIKDEKGQALTIDKLSLIRQTLNQAPAMA